MFPVKYCGYWSLIACTNPQLIGSELLINYNTITFTRINNVGPIQIKKIFMVQYLLMKILQK